MKFSVMIDFRNPPAMAAAASQLPGMDPVVATRSLQLFAEEVMPRFPD
jgi:hypothetical protein